MNIFDHYIAVDWAQENMAIARMTASSNEIKVMDVKGDLSDLCSYLKEKRGKKILTFEETTTAQWLYTELKPLVDQIVVCDPYRNRLLAEGPKTDKIDATKLVQLLRSDLLKPVFHSGDSTIELRKLVSGYNDTIQAGVKSKNRRAALLRGVGNDESNLSDSSRFVITGLDASIASYEEERGRYEAEFRRYRRNLGVIGKLESIPGIGLIGAVKIVALVVDARRFPNRRRFWSYCGLIRHDRVSGGRSYGRKEPRYSRMLKSVFKTAALAAIDGDNAFGEEYRLRVSQGSPQYMVRHDIARKIAAAALGVMRTGKRFDEKVREERKAALENRS